MTSRDFAYWLQGFFEVSRIETLTKDQTQIIKNHLNLVFKHDIDSQYKPGDGTQEVHDGNSHLIVKPNPSHNNSNNVLLRC